MEPDSPRILHLGPDAPGGMSAVMRGLLSSPLSRRFRLEFVATYRSPQPVRRIAVFLVALVKLMWWSVRARGRVVHVHGTVRGSMYRKSVCALLAKALRRRVVLHLHSGPGDVTATRARLGRASVVLFRRAFRAADAVLAVSRQSAAALEDAYGIDGIVVVPHAAPEGPASPAPSDEQPRLLYLGGFANPVKGGETLIAALERPELARLRVVLAGPGEAPERVRELVGEGQPLEWRGWLEEADKEQLLSAGGIFVLPSASEGLPMALLEAMAYGLPIVATEVGGVPDTVVAGREAILVAPCDPERLADAVARLAADQALRERLGCAAWERARSLSADEVTARLTAIYEQLLC